MITAKAFKPIGPDGQAKIITGRTVREIEEKAEQWGATVLTLWGETLYRIEGEWIAI